MAERVVRTGFDPVVCRPHIVGNPIEKTFRLSRDPKGNAVYTEAGEIDVRTEIQSYTNGCSLEAQLVRMQFVPLHEKVQMLQQMPDGVSADLSNMPKDGTEARIMFNNMLKAYPQVFERIQKGESFDAVMKEVFMTSTASENKNEKEKTENGTE